MKITEGNISYYPRISDDGKTVYGQDAYAVKVPQGYDRAKLYPVILLVHGMGERSQGTLADIKNVWLGFDYDGAGPLPRQYAIATDEFNKALDQYGIIGVAVTYGGEFNPTDVDWVMDAVEAEYAVDRTREAIVGFSLGGGAVIREGTSSLAAAKRWVLMVGCAPVNWATNYKYIVDAKTQFIGTTNRTDPTVNPSNVKTMVASINALNPVIPADLIVFEQDGHGSFNEMLMLSHPQVPQNIYEYIKSVSTDNRLPYPTSKTNPVPPVTTIPPVTTVKPVTSFTLTGTTARLIGSKSTGYKDGLDGVWELVSGPATSRQVFPTGSSYIDATAQLPAEGTYVFRFALKGAEPVDMTVQRGSVVTRSIKTVDLAAKTVTFSDNTTETLKSVTTSVKTYEV